MSESNDCRVEARECIRKANSCDDSQNRWAWLVLAKSWLLLAETQEIAKNRIKQTKVPLSTIRLSLFILEVFSALSCLMQQQLGDVHRDPPRGTERRCSRNRFLIQASMIE